MSQARRQRKPASSKSKSSSHNGDAPFWHPAVHRQFGEELFYFLVAAKPFDERKCFDGVKVALQKFGVSKYCVYQIFGQFDIMVRVWLPAGHAQEFIENAAESIANLQSIIPFHVSHSDEQWRFPETLSDEAKSEITQLSPSIIAQVQNRSDLDLVKRLKDLHLLNDIPDYRSLHASSIKVFIGISEPDTTVKDKREALFRNAVDILKSITKLKQATVYSGYGFTWILIKMVSPDFYTIGEIVDRFSEEFREDGAATSTYLVATGSYHEGECISKWALETNEGDENVRLLLPELYSTPSLDEVLKDDIERFVKKHLIPKDSMLEVKDKLALQAFLKAIIAADHIEAYTALFPRFVRSEQELREDLVRVTSSGPLRIDAMVAELDPERKTFKGVKTMPLAFVLKGIRLLTSKCSLNGDVMTKYPDVRIDGVAEYRNRIMHGAPFDIRSAWKPYANAVVELAIVRNELLQKLIIYENNLKNI